MTLPSLSPLFGKTRRTRWPTWGPWRTQPSASRTRGGGGSAASSSWSTAISASRLRLRASSLTPRSSSDAAS